VARDEPLGLEPVESPSALSSGPKGLQVERLEAERLGRVEGRCLFAIYQWEKSRQKREEGKTPQQISC